jgi:tRNA A-37 threonylcarbamoyl transferase component Bud32
VPFLHAPSAEALPTATPAAGPAAAPGLPSRIGKYVVQSKIGEGATSEVFLCLDPFNNRKVAVKRVRSHGLADSREQHFQQRFFAAEAALVGQLQHPNVVQILDAVADAEAPYLVMEYVDGVTLRRYGRADRLLPVQQIIEIGFKCAMALGYCFRRGLIHRDVKPANLLVRLEGERITEVKVTDFGSVFNATTDQTQVYRVGSLAYMSPEQLDGDGLDCRADIYSLASVLYHLLAGRPPFDAPLQPVLMHQIYHVEPPPLTALREGLPGALVALVARCLAKDRAQRPDSWEDFARALSAAGAEHRGSVVDGRGASQEVLDSERFTLLRGLEFFAEFGDVELWEVVHRAAWVRHACGDALYRKGEEGSSFHVITQGRVEVYRDGRKVATLGAGSTVGEMAYLAPNPALRRHTVDILASQPTTTLSFTPDSLERLGLSTRHRFDKAFIQVLVRRLHEAQETAAQRR